MEKLIKNVQYFYTLKKRFNTCTTDFSFNFVWEIWLTQLPEVDPAENWLTRYLHFQEPESKNSAILLKL